MMDKINRPPLQCTVRRSDSSAKLPSVSDGSRKADTLVIGSDGSIPTPILEHIDKVSKMRIFDDEPSQPRQ